MRWLVCRTIAVALICGCAETATEATDPPSPLEVAAFPALVSDPGPGAADPARGDLSAHWGMLEPLVWIALPPASVPAGVEATAENQRTGALARTPVIDGGFDPIPLAAEPGDTLRISVELSDGGMAAARTVVPARRRPRVVRTSPVAGRRDVAINSSVVVVFSEPIAASSVDPANIRIVRASAPVPGTLRPVDGAPTSIEFTPEAPFEAGAAYELVVGSGIVDLSGDPLDAAITVPFATAGQESGVPTADVGLDVLAVSAGGIVVYDPDGTYLERLSDPAASRPDDPFTHDFFPAWSRDGGRIAFSRIIGEYDPAFGDISYIYVMNADGSSQVRITPVDGHAMRPTWSPDGSRIAFQTRRNAVGNDEIYVMNADGSNPVRLTNHLQPGWGPAWSPDGTKIAYVTYDEVGNADIFVMNPDGSGRVNLTNDVGFDNDPDWSPDGSRIAFTKDADLFIMNADGTNPSRIELAGTANTATIPKWSPDGLSILYATTTWCDWGETCPDYLGPPATIVRLSDGFQRPLPGSIDGMIVGHWSWRPRR